jgi:hypothetical protein
MVAGVDLPEYVKTAEVDDMHDLRKLPKAAFADPERMIYPINNAARVYVSNAHFINKRADIVKLYGEDYASQIQKEIEKAAEILDISQDLQDYNSSLNVKLASDYGSQYMVDDQMDIGGFPIVMQLYPVKTASDLTDSAEAFVKNISKFPFQTRIKSAENFVKAAEELGVDELPDLICKYAGMYFPDLGPTGMRQEVWRRSTKLASVANKAIYSAIIDDLSNMTNLSEVMKVAETMFHIENSEGLYDNTKTAQLLGDPVDMLLTEQITKVASDLSYVEVHGDKYKLDDLSKISKDKYEEAFGDSGIDPAYPEKIAEILPTMPRSDMKLLEEITGLRPV